MNKHSRTALGYLSWLTLLIYLLGIFAYPSSCSGLPSLKTDEVSSLVSTTATHAVTPAHHFTSVILFYPSTHFIFFHSAIDLFTPLVNSISIYIETIISNGLHHLCPNYGRLHDENEKMRTGAIATESPSLFYPGISRHARQL